MKHRLPLKIAGATFILLLVATAVVLELSAAGWVRRWLERSARDLCAECSLTIAESDIRWLGRELRLSGLKFHAGEARATEVEANVREIRVTLNPLRLVFGAPRISSLTVIGPHIIVREGDGRSSSFESAGGERTRFSIGQVRVEQGEFTYARVYRHGTGEIRLREIDLTISEVGTTPELLEEPAVSHAEGRLGKSGRFALEIRAPLGLPEPRIDIRLDLKDVVLTELESYFRVSDGLELQGRLLSGRGDSKIRGRASHSRVEVSYDGLSMHAIPTRKRGKLATWVTNLVAKLKLDPANRGETRPGRVRSVDLMRDPDESLVSFALRGFRDAALEIASSR